MILFYDTETVGLPRLWNAPATDLANWPRMIQLAYILCKDSGEVISRHQCLIKPEGFEIPVAASNIHGVTTERAMAEGINLEQAISDFEKACNEALFYAAHNINFDRKIVGAEFIRTGRENPMDSKPNICTMQSSTKFCAIAGPYGPKWPKLQELHKKLFGFEFDGAHDALADVDATARCFFELRRLGIL